MRRNIGIVFRTFFDRVFVHSRFPYGLTIIYEEDCYLLTADHRPLKRDIVTPWQLVGIGGGWVGGGGIGRSCLCRAKQGDVVSH